ERQVIPDLLPQTGISLEMEQLLSSTFIQSPTYGTRCSNFLRVKRGQWQWLEKSQQGDMAGQVVEKIITLQ
ncbi:MAG TPA: serine/threonine protein phosphatase, partial [Acinetobacter lwoffii]|nr:serine/threonine protein phosphatase [Acinetobacter lwoffii]